MSEKIHLTSLTQTRVPEVDARETARFCPKCGREIPLDRSVCAFCENTGMISRPVVPKKRNLVIFSLVLGILFLLLLWVGYVGSRKMAADAVMTAVDVVPTVTPFSRGTAVPVILLP